MSVSIFKSDLEMYAVNMLSNRILNQARVKSNFPTQIVRLTAMSMKNPPLLEFLEKRDISLKSLIHCALEMFVPHPGIETEEKAAEMLREEFLDVLSDVNVSILEVAAFRVQEDAEKGLVPGLTQERFKGRPGLGGRRSVGFSNRHLHRRNPSCFRVRKV